MAGEWVYPIDPVADDSRISWKRTHPSMPEHWPGTGPLLGDFCELERAQPAEMASFVARYGMPEIRDGHVTEGPGTTRSTRAGWISVGDLREHARACSAARRLGAALVVRRPGDPEDWHRLEGVGIHTRADDVGDWKLGRERLAYWLTELMRQADVGTGAEWLGSKGLALDPAPGTLLGVMVLLLAREIGAEGEYACDSCGARVVRSRPPREGERVYCKRSECRREQQRRNQAAWRARRAESGD